MLFGIEIEFWHWWVLALVFMALEMTAGAYFFLWIAASSAVLGAIIYFVPEMSIEMQMGIWAALSTLSITFWYYHRKGSAPQYEEEDLKLNQRGKQIVGRKFTLEEPIVNGEGKINVDDSWWKVESDTDMKVGKKVEVVSVDGTVLVVKAV